ncbi:MAG: hypothetical protein QOH75_411, partial [Actinomycetota bacterium]|nr:hypothetical protein [Actinomycetota bacterium]
MHHITRRVIAVAIGTGAMLAAVAPAASATTGGPNPKSGSQWYSAYDRNAQAAAWLVTQLTGPDKDHFNFPGTTFADDGNTADGLLALDAAGVAHSAAERMLAWLQADAGNYAGTTPNFYPGSLAKLLFV